MALTIVPCLIHWKQHNAHDWWYTSEGGGHMLSNEYVQYETKKHLLTQFHCLGLFYASPKHRGNETHRWRMGRPMVYVPKHRGEYAVENDRIRMDERLTLRYNVL